MWSSTALVRRDPSFAGQAKSECWRSISYIEPSSIAHPYRASPLDPLRIRNAESSGLLRAWSWWDVQSGLGAAASHTSYPKTLDLIDQGRLPKIPFVHGLDIVIIIPPSSRSRLSGVCLRSTPAGLPSISREHRWRTCIQTPRGLAY